MDLTSPVYFNDKDIKIRQSGITIKCYYFPTCTSKRIPFSTIKDIRLITQSSCCYWGSDQHEYWFAFDSKRNQRNSFISIDNGHSLKPAFTCTDNQKCYKILKQLLMEQRLRLSSKSIKQSQVESQ